MVKRLFIISNRLPITVNINKDEIDVQTSSGGLVSAITGYLENNPGGDIKEFKEILWIGVPGCGAGLWQKAANKIANDHFSCLPVFLAKKSYEQYYNGFSNSVVWPLFHYFPSFVEYNQVYFESYVSVNQSFMEIIAEQATRDDVLWIHDYHLLPLASMIRARIPGITIGFFLHIPFPSYEIFRIMPTAWQESIMLGLLGADLIGFHTIDYASHFLTSAQMILGMDHETNILRYQNRLIKVDVFPISIDYNKFFDAHGRQEVADIRDSLRSRFIGKKLIFSVDRLDYTKGVYNRLRAFEYFLKQNPEYSEKVIFILVTVPSRDSISKYAERKKMIDEFIGHFNSSVGSIHWQPIVYQYNSLNFDELIAMYSACDLALITPLRDGMNLVAKEFIASRKDLRGVLVLSDMAGAARELTGALLINPNDMEDIAAKIKQGLEMSEEEQETNLVIMQQRIKQYNVSVWATDYLTQLKRIKEKQREFEIKFIDQETNNMILDKFTSARKRLFLLDYDGTLIPFSPLPEQAVPDKNLLELLTDLSQNEDNTVYVISGRDSKTLDNWFGKIPINIVAEHGAKIKSNNGRWHSNVESSSKWKKEIEKIMEVYVQRCVNSFVETKDFSVAWHYRNANSEQGKLRASELYIQLEGYTNNLGLQVIMGNKVIEVRNSGVNKGNATQKILKTDDFDFILSIGDDTTDEDMFRELASVEHAITIKIGQDASFAKYNLDSPQMVISFLDMLRENIKKEERVQLLD